MQIDQKDLIERAIIIAGSVGNLATIMKVRRETVTRWLHLKHNLRLSHYLELVEWLKKEEKKKSIGKAAKIAKEAVS